MNTSSNSEHNRIVVLDTETTGMNQEGGPHYLGHRIIEIGAVEIINRKLTGRHFHVYIKPIVKFNLRRYKYTVLPMNSW